MPGNPTQCLPTVVVSRRREELSPVDSLRQEVGPSARPRYGVGQLSAGRDPETGQTPRPIDGTRRTVALRTPGREVAGRYSLSSDIVIVTLIRRSGVINYTINNYTD